MAKSGKKKKGGARRLKPLIAAFLILVTFACLAWVLLLPPQEDGDTSRPGGKTVDRAKTSPKPDKGRYTFEEKLAPDFDQKVRQIDLILMQALAESSDQAQVRHNKIRTKHFHGSPFHYQELEIGFVHSPEDFLHTLRRELRRFTSNASLVTGPDDSTWYVRINGERTHTLFLRSDAPGKRPEPSGKLAIVIDDMGRSRKAASRLAELDFPVTFSILPHSAFSKTVRRIATASKLPIMLHLPMQPDNWPDTDPGPGALFVDMSRDKIRETARQDLDLVPEAIGVNNHMGSRFTAYQAGMEELFRELRDRELFFLDSLTTPQSVASRISGRFGINLLKRDIFLDNIQDKTAIIFQLRKAEKIASDTGLAIAIGHPYPETLDALETWNKNRDNGVEVVGINDLL